MICWTSWRRPTLAEVQQRHGETKAEEQKLTAHAIAVGALAVFFLLKFTRNAIIAFDFKDALSFEGETGAVLPICGGADSRNSTERHGSWGRRAWR